MINLHETSCQSLQGSNPQSPDHISWSPVGHAYDCATKANMFFFGEIRKIFTWYPTYLDDDDDLAFYIPFSII